MATWRPGEPGATFEDMPQELQDIGPDSPAELKERRAVWLEANDLSMVDYMSWRRARQPLAALRPPSRRKFMSTEQLAELDARREQEGEPEW